MITLFTGNPRSGKTASMVDLLIDLAEERPIYVHAPTVKRKGVDPFHEHLKLPHTPVDADKWPELVPDGAVLVVDEVQDLWRPRGPGSKVPEAIRELETHGHRGVDIILTTQKPRLVDQSVRDLVGRHVHIRDTGWLGRWSYEWPEVSETLAWKTCKLKKRFKVPKRTFGVYKSANLHTSAARGKSFMPMLTGGLVLASLLLVFMVVRTIRSHVDPAPAVASAASSPASASAPAGKRGTFRQLAEGAVGVSAATLAVAFNPRVQDRPETAPAYDELRRVVNMPRVVGGYCIGERCRCINQQNLDAGLSDAACKAWLKSPPFDPYFQREPPPSSRMAPSEASARQQAPSQPARHETPRDSPPTS